MNSSLRLFLISLIALLPLITCNCGDLKDNSSNETQPDGQTINLTVNGMTCDSCKSIVEGALNQVSGVIASEVSVATKSVKVIYNPNTVDVAKLKQTIADAGYTVVD